MGQASIQWDKSLWDQQSARDILAGVIQGEAASAQGQFDVAAVIWNRLSDVGSGYVGYSQPGVLEAVVDPSQFNGMRVPSATAYQFADAILDGTLPQYGDPGNAAFYSNPDVPGVGAWAQGLLNGGYADGTGNIFSDRYGAPSSNFEPPSYYGLAGNAQGFRSQQAIGPSSGGKAAIVTGKPVSNGSGFDPAGIQQFLNFVQPIPGSDPILPGQFTPTGTTPEFSVPAPQSPANQGSSSYVAYIDDGAVAQSSAQQNLASAGIQESVQAINPYGALNTNGSSGTLLNINNMTLGSSNTSYSGLATQIEAQNQQIGALVSAGFSTAPLADSNVLLPSTYALASTDPVSGAYAPGSAEAAQLESNISAAYSGEATPGLQLSATADGGSSGASSFGITGTIPFDPSAVSGLISSITGGDGGGGGETGNGGGNGNGDTPDAGGFDLGGILSTIGDFLGNFLGGLFGPVELDLAGNGIKITPVSSSNMFLDTTGSGYKNQVAWAGAGNAVLFIDPTNSNTITQANQYIFTDWDPTATSDMQALLDVFDTNHSGTLDSGDADWSQFKLMVTNANGTTSVETLAQAGITSINLTGNNISQTFSDGSAIQGETTYTTTSGITGTAASVSFAYDSNGDLMSNDTTRNAGRRKIPPTKRGARASYAPLIKFSSAA